MRDYIERWQAMGHKFSMVLSREITNDESATLLQAGCGNTIFAIDSLPSDADVPVTKMDFDDTVSQTLAEAIGAVFETVKEVSDLSVPMLTVPAQPAQAEDGEPDPVQAAAESQ